MYWLDNFLKVSFKVMAKSKYRYSACPRIAKKILWFATKDFPKNTYLRIVIDTNIWILGEDIFTTFPTGKNSGWLTSRAARYIESIEQRAQVEYFAPLRSLILDKGYLGVFYFPGMEIEHFYRKEKKALFGLDMWESLKPHILTFSKGRTLQSYLMSLGNSRPKSCFDLPEFERLWLAYAGYNTIEHVGKSLLRVKLWNRIYQEGWDQRYIRLVDALANKGNPKNQTQDAWYLRMLELKEFNIDYFISLDTVLINKIRNSKDMIFKKVKDKILTPKEFCEQHGIRPISIKYLAFNEASYPVDSNVIVQVMKKHLEDA